MPAFTIVPSGPFDLARAAGFGFGPNAGGELPMRLAFCLDSLEGHAGVTLTQTADGSVHGEVEGSDDVDAVQRQVARILSLDGDGQLFADVGARDPVLGELQAQYPGLRPVLFHSPYEAAAWSIVSARRPMAQAAATREEICATHGATFAAGSAFPTPRQLLGVGPMKGLPSVKVERLHALAAAALEGALDQRALIAMDPADADVHLQTLPGIGPFYAMLILVRGTGHHDVISDDRRFRDFAARFYGPARDYVEITEGWRPFRTWAGVLVTYAARRAAGPGAPG